MRIGVVSVVILDTLVDDSLEIVIASVGRVTDDVMGLYDVISSEVVVGSIVVDG